MFYNKSAKRQRRLKELAQKPQTTTVEDTAINTLEKTVEKTLEKGTYILTLLLNYLSNSIKPKKRW